MTITNDKILQNVSDLKNYIIETRRYLHENPELSGKEFETSIFLKNEVEKLGLELVEVEGTGFYAILDTGREGKTIGLRTDIDALPIRETYVNLKSERICRSKVDGIFHACGHDGHMATLLASMRILTSMKDDLSGRIIFIFEEGEEIGCGINKMVEALRKEKIDAIYGNHLASFMDSGKIAFDAGPVMAGSAVIDFTVKGRGGHGSRPDLSISPIFAATNIINGLASAWANRIDVTKTVTLGLGTIHGGTAGNIIPDEVRVTGTLRFFDLEEGEKAIDLVRKVGSLTSEAHECRFLENQIYIQNPNVDNDPYLAELARESIGEILPDNIETGIQWFASETFSHYNEISKTLFSFVGVRNAELGSGAEHHNEYFDLDEEALPIAVIAMVKYATSFLES